MLVEGIRQLHAAFYALVHSVEDRLENRIGEAHAQQIQRLHERHACLQQRGELLVELEEITGTDASAAAESRRQPGQQSGRPDRQDEHPLLFEVAAELRLVLSGVDAVDELASRGSKPTAIFHRKRLSDSTLPASRTRWPDYSNSAPADEFGYLDA
jgi:hypothetical protein